MKRKLVASVLLASMAFTIPAYADGEGTPDEYDRDARYVSPLNQSHGSVVNEYHKPQPADEGETFAKAAGRLVQGEASGKSANADKNVVQEKAEQQAEQVLEKTDEYFEPAQTEELPGHEYQARRQVASLETGSPLSLRETQNTGTETGLTTKSTAVSDVVSVTQPETSAKLSDSPAVSKNSEKKGKKKEKPLPLVVTGDDAQYANDSGDFIIEGNVRLQQGETTLVSTKAVGNAKTGDVWLLEGGTLAEPTNTMKAHWAHYNFNQKTGELLHIKGAARPHEGSSRLDFYEAPHAVVENGMLIADQGGTTTRCPAVQHTPCLSVKAKTITIIPNDRIIARGVQVFVKGKLLYSRNVWINDLKKGKSTLMPRVGWKDDYGWYVSLDYEMPIGNPKLKNPTTFTTHQVYYTKSHYKPFYSLRHDEPDFYVRLNDGYVYDSDDDTRDDGVWLHKKTDWGLFLKPHRIARGLPLTYDASITHGLWKYTNQSWSSWHTENVIRLRHDRFYPLGGKKLYMDLMVGHKWVRESLDNATTRRYGKSLNTGIYTGTIGYRFSDKWNIWETFHKENKTSYLFTLGQPDFSREWRTGIEWTPDDRNSIVIVNRHNADKGSWSHGNYSTMFAWSHRFCCEVLSVAYERKHYKHDNSWTVRFDFLNW